MIDSHTHLDGAEDPLAVVDRAVDAGVAGMIAIGCGIESIERTLEIARQRPQHVRVVAGVHPNSAATFDLGTWGEVERLARDPLVVGIGETGLDQYREHATLEQQLPLLRLHAALARELDLPLIIHTRAAEDATIEALDRDADGLRVVLHCCSLVEERHVDALLARERWVASFAGNITYPSAGELRATAARIPLDRLMVETDAPYLAPVPHRGATNEPAYVAHTVERLAEVRGMDVEELAASTARVAERLFGWTPAVAATDAGAAWRS